MLAGGDDDVARSHSVDECFATLEVDPDGAARAVARPAFVEALCAGHFPGDPVVPGAYLLGLMAALAERLGVGSVCEVARCVLVAPVHPGQSVVLAARRSLPADPGGVEVTVHADDRLAARARLILEPRP